MELDLLRDPATLYSWPGKMAVDGIFECYTLERAPTDPDFKPIPIGRYPVKLMLSIKFKILMPQYKRLIPHILNVPGRDAIEIHMGNRVQDTEGCVLVGRQTGEDEIYSSLIALSNLTDKLEKTTDEIYITVQEAQNENQSMA